MGNSFALFQAKIQGPLRPGVWCVPHVGIRQRKNQELRRVEIELQGNLSKN